MAKKLLIPVFPSDRFYEAVVRAADIVAEEGGLVTFAFTQLRPPPDTYARDGDGRPTDLDVAIDTGGADGREIERWRAAQIAALEEARQLLTERGVREAQIDYLFADEADGEGVAQAIADEAAAGAYDMVVLARGYFENEVSQPDDSAGPRDVADAVRELEGPTVLVV